MKTCYFEILNHPYGLAQINLTLFCPVLPLSKEATFRNYLVTRVIVPREHRNKGVATRLLKQMCYDADVLGVTLHLEPAPYYGISYERLVTLYKRVGFEFVLDGVMERPPK